MKLKSILRSNHDLKKNGYHVLRKLHKIETRKGASKAYASAFDDTFFFVLGVRALVEIINKEYPEELVFLSRCDRFLSYLVLECRKLLTDRNIERIAAAVAAACKADRDTTSVKRIKAAIQEADTAIENLWKALESGQAADMITQRIEKRQREKEDMEAQLAVEMGKQVTLTAPQIRAYLYSLKKGDINDENTKRGIINIFLRAVYLYDDRFTLILNGSEKPVTIDDALLDEIEEEFASARPDCGLCSPLVAAAPPRRRGRHIVRGDFFTKVTSHSFCRGSFPNRTRFAGLRFGFGRGAVSYCIFFGVYIPKGLFSVCPGESFNKPAKLHTYGTTADRDVLLTYLYPKSR